MAGPLNALLRLASLVDISLCTSFEGWLVKIRIRQRLAILASRWLIVDQKFCDLIFRPLSILINVVDTALAAIIEVVKALIESLRVIVVLLEVLHIIRQLVLPLQDFLVLIEPVFVDS